jgi:hypothetical protein
MTKLQNHFISGNPVSDQLKCVCVLWKGGGKRQEWSLLKGVNLLSKSLDELSKTFFVSKVNFKSPKITKYEKSPFFSLRLRKDFCTQRKDSTNKLQ